MFRFNGKNLVYLLVLIIPFFLFFSQPNLFTNFQLKLVSLFSTPVRLFAFPLREVKKILYYHRTFDEYKRLKHETDVLKARLVGLEEVVRENTRLEQLLEFKRKLIFSSVTASVIGRDPSRWNASMIIDKGKKDGIEQGMSVVNALGVVGKIGEVGGGTSKVLLLTDSQFSVAGLVQRTGDSGLVSGTIKGVCQLRFMNPDTDIRVGDKVVTSKLSTSFPESLIIGEIVEDGKKEGASKDFVIKPAVSFSQIEEVLVIKN